MSDLPELPLFEEIEDISTSPNFFTYTQDEFNKTWSYYESEATTTQSASKSLWDTPPSGGQSPVTNTSAKASPTRDAWDPMLWNMTLTKYVEISQETEVVGRLPELETPISHLTCLANMYLEQGLNTPPRCPCHSSSKPQSRAPTSCPSLRPSEPGRRQARQNSCRQLPGSRKVSGESCFRRRVS